MPTETEGDPTTVQPPFPPATPLPELVAKVYAVLEPLPSELRQRVVAATLVMLGEEPHRSSVDNSARAGSRVETHRTTNTSEADQDSSGLPEVAKRWVTQNGLTLDILQNYFHFDEGKIKLFASPVQTKSKREQTTAVYLLMGAASLLETGTPSFTDEAARETCREFGCYDRPNHTGYLKDIKAKITGSKEAGWKLTQPGLIAVAELLKPKSGG